MYGPSVHTQVIVFERKTGKEREGDKCVCVSEEMERVMSVVYLCFISQFYSQSKKVYHICSQHIVVKPFYKIKRISLKVITKTHF